jgi:uncharacterized protein
MFRKLLLFSFLFSLATFFCFGKEDNFPAPPNPPRLVNDFAGMMTPLQQDNLEAQLDSFARQTSNQVTIITIKNLDGYDPSEYVTQLGIKWGVGGKGKDNGVIIFASEEDHKINISPGMGLEGALTDMTCGQIIRNEMAPEFRNGNYFLGFQKAVNSVIAATKGEYKPDPAAKSGGGNPLGLLVLIIVIVILIMLFSRGGGKGGGNYMSRRGGDFLTGAILGSLLGGGRGGGLGGGGGFGGGGGGGFGGFGGGSFGGGGASGGW